MPDDRTFKKSSIRDVARQAAVSVTTVSHVVSGTKGYSRETIKRVKDAIEALNYVPSYAANALQKRATMTIGVCVRDPFLDSDCDVRSYPDRLWAGVLREANINNYKVMHFPTSIQDSADAAQFLNGQIDGLIIAANNLDERPAKLANAGLPVVMVARKYDIPEGVDSVTVDENVVIDLGLKYLRGLGHERIALVAGPVERPSSNMTQPKLVDDVAMARLNAYENWMRRNEPDFAPLYVSTESWGDCDLEPVLRDWMDSHQPTAILSANDKLARAVLRAARIIGIDVPGQLSVLGIDNDQLSALTKPSLSSIDIPIQDIGRQAVRTLLLRLRGESSSSQPFDVPVSEITVRDSTGPAPALLS